MEVTVYGPLRSRTGEKTVEVEADPETVEDALRAFLAAYPRAESQLLAESGEIRSSVRVLVDGDRRELDESVEDGASLSLTPAVQGGAN